MSHLDCMLLFDMLMHVAGLCVCVYLYFVVLEPASGFVSVFNFVCLSLSVP